MEKAFEIWAEGYAESGGRGVASFHGKVVADTFENACTKKFSEDTTFNADKLTLWACRLFDNKEDASVRFG